MIGWEALKDGTSIEVVCILWRRRRRTAQKMINPPATMIAIPPSTPPTIEPTDTPDAEEVVVVDVGTGPPVTSGWAAAAISAASVTLNTALSQVEGFVAAQNGMPCEMVSPDGRYEVFDV